MAKVKLIIFVKNEEVGKVKTRLAKTVGDEEALKIYQKLLQHTFDQVKPLEVKKEVWYSKYIDKDDLWNEEIFSKKIQRGNDLGERMSQACRESFGEEGMQKVVIIGSDCAELTTEILYQAFRALDQYDLVIGPATDGGYYLLGMSSYFPALFKDIAWSSDIVLKQTIKKAKHEKADYYLLEELNDVDQNEDWELVKDRFEQE